MRKVNDKWLCVSDDFKLISRYMRTGQTGHGWIGGHRDNNNSISSIWILIIDDSRCTMNSNREEQQFTNHKVNHEEIIKIIMLRLLLESKNITIGDDVDYLHFFTVTI